MSVLLAGCSSPGATLPQADPDMSDAVGVQSVSGTPGAVGGSVKNSAPTVQSFTQSATTGDNKGGFVVVFSGVVKDANTETQIETISVTATGPAALGASHTITVEERAATAAPASFGADGFKVWTATPRDGVLNFQYRQVFPALAGVGAYAFTAKVADRPGLVATSAPLSVTITAFSEVVIDPTPVSAAGVSLPGQTWGQWNAEAGARDVASLNYIKLVNTGQVADARLVIDFADAFVGAEDAEFRVPVANNLQFAWWEDVTPATSAPSEGQFTYRAANADGTTTVQFSGLTNVIYVTYRIVALPEVLPVQSYGISFTVTEL